MWYTQWWFFALIVVLVLAVLIGTGNLDIAVSS